MNSAVSVSAFRPNAAPPSVNAVKARCHLRQRVLHHGLNEFLPQRGWRGFVQPSRMHTGISNTRTPRAARMSKRLYDSAGRKFQVGGVKVECLYDGLARCLTTG